MIFVLFSDYKELNFDLHLILHDFVVTGAFAQPHFMPQLQRLFIKLLGDFSGFCVCSTTSVLPEKPVTKQKREQRDLTDPNLTNM